MNWNAALYDDRHSFVAAYGRGLLEDLAPRPGERILDVGCGTGTLTAQIAASGAKVVGLDSSPEMVAAARERYPDLEWVVASATDFRFEEPFDAVFSNAALHWVKPPEEAARRMAGALRPGGRLAIEMGGAGNIRLLAGAIAAETGVPHPWYFPSVGQYAAILEESGLEVRQAALFDRPTPLVGDDAIRTWIEQFAPQTILGVDPARLPDVYAAIEARLAPNLRTDDGWIADYRRLRILAVRL